MNQSMKNSPRTRRLLKVRSQKKKQKTKNQKTKKKKKKNKKLTRFDCADAMEVDTSQPSSSQKPKRKRGQKKARKPKSGKFVFPAANFGAFVRMLVMALRVERFDATEDELKQLLLIVMRCQAEMEEGVIKSASELSTLGSLIVDKLCKDNSILRFVFIQIGFREKFDEQKNLAVKKKKKKTKKKQKKNTNCQLCLFRTSSFHFSLKVNLLRIRFPLTLCSSFFFDKSDSCGLGAFRDSVVAPIEENIRLAYVHTLSKVGYALPH